MIDRLLDQLCDAPGADGAVCVPLRHKQGAHVVASLNGTDVIGTPLFVAADEGCSRAATMQEIHDARLDRPVTNRYEEAEVAQNRVHRGGIQLLPHRHVAL